MLPIAMPLLWYLQALLLPRHSLALEIAALRQQLAVFKRKQPWPPMRAGPAVLDRSPPFLALLVRRADPGKARDRALLASRRL